MYSLVKEQKGLKHVGLQSSKNKNFIIYHMTIGCICSLKL
jgi:hypothetical protein